jgi:hypothetical protein
MIILPDDPLVQAIIRRAQQDIPILESPPASNRSPEIDAMCIRWGVPLGSAWCALWVATVWADAGAAVPPIKGDSHPARVESWRVWALETNRFSHSPMIGAAVLYGAHGTEPGSHIGACVTAITPILMNFEGNTTVTGFESEGELTSSKPVSVDRLIGYVHPRPLA